LKKLIFIIVLFPIFSIAQNSKGTVIDKKTNLPIEAVNVTMSQFNLSMTTNENGIFKLKITTKLQENDTIFFSHIGYITKKMNF